MHDPCAQKGRKHLWTSQACQLAAGAEQITQSEPSCISCASTSISGLRGHGTFRKRGWLMPSKSPGSQATQQGNAALPAVQPRAGPGAGTPGTPGWDWCYGTSAGSNPGHLPTRGTSITAQSHEVRDPDAAGSVKRYAGCVVIPRRQPAKRQLSVSSAGSQPCCGFSTFAT